jgi:tyrosinase
VLIFLGDVLGDADRWRTSWYVGGHHPFVNNCRKQADIVVEGFVHLNLANAKKSGLNLYEPE